MSAQRRTAAQATKADGDGRATATLEALLAT